MNINTILLVCAGLAVAFVAGIIGAWVIKKALGGSKDGGL